ncbi:50S ribosomal protein L18 [Candidatus Tachikawaea gelatinosa]|uniref:Large ribosomal subunit protein uL18 n=1 Tax=Candidatus Tachikawaea gelatinosa TaxID=1410383 RepID=A0A090AL71_9ENTR|nr:50S ribosomal protein L18 [Candidatus Tachikawaea gelatinosa]BAP58359.1 50S ribosomal protein L18 [Candidatus Tachikawaea gelatinosa]
MLKKKIARLRRSNKTKHRIKKLKIHRLLVHRSSRHIYAQIFNIDNDQVLASASSLEKKYMNEIKKTGNKEAAILVGKNIAKRSIKIGIKKVAFDRSGFQYHGRIKALAESAREYGLNF